MKIELKKLKVNLAFSEETTMFQSELAINGIIVGNAYNDGRGGCTFYSAYRYGLSDEEIRRNEELIKKAEDYCKSLPKEKVDFGNGKIVEFEQTLESVIDNLVLEKEKEKDNKKRKKLCESNIVYGFENGISYKYIGFKSKQKLSEIAKTENGKKAIQQLIDRVKGEMKKGEIIFNDNLSVLGFKI